MDKPDTRLFILKICFLQAVVVLLMTWQIFATKIFEAEHNAKRLAFCVELHKELPKIDCKQLEN